MSVINRVLKDLDQKGASPSTLSGVQVVQTSQAAARPLWPWLLLLPVALLAAWWYWPAVQQPASPAPLVAPETTPPLHLSEAPDNQVVTPPLQAGMVGAAAGFPVAPEPTLAATGKAESQRELKASALAAAKTSDVEEKASRPALSIKLDARLPEPQQSKVIKEIRPLSPREQTEQAWRQAAHLIELGRGRDALGGLEEILRQNPSHGPARQTLIALSLEAGDTARAEALLREGLQLHTTDAWYHRSLGQVYLQRGDTAQSAAILKAGLGKGVDADYWGLYAGILNKSGRHEEASQAYREAARLNPAHGPWWIGLAVSLEQGGQRPAAAAAYQRALQTRLSPDLREFAVRKAGELSTP